MGVGSAPSVTLATRLNDILLPSLVHMLSTGTESTGLCCSLSDHMTSIDSRSCTSQMARLDSLPHLIDQVLTSLIVLRELPALSDRYRCITRLGFSARLTIAVDPTCEVAS